GYSVVTPKRALATCLIAERRQLPFASGLNRSGSSPPSPVLDLPPMRFMAMARFSWASLEMEPKDIAPVTKRLTISLAGSTWSMGMATDFLKLSRPRRVQRFLASSLTSLVNSLKVAKLLMRVECWSLATVSGFHMWYSAPFRH